MGLGSEVIHLARAFLTYALPLNAAKLFCAAALLLLHADRVKRSKTLELMQIYYLVTT